MEQAPLARRQALLHSWNPPSAIEKGVIEPGIERQMHHGTSL